MKASATLAGLAALVAAAPAQAGVVAEMKVGSSLGQLVAGPDGGAWVVVDRGARDGAIGRAQPDGRFRTAATDRTTLDGAVGPDGNAWYQTISSGFLRADASDSLALIGDANVRDKLEIAFATGPDGTLWSPTVEHDGFWHIAADGTATRVPGGLPGDCSSTPHFLQGMARASDGAMWVADEDCPRVDRVAAERSGDEPSGRGSGTSTVTLDVQPQHLAADPFGGVWVTNQFSDDGQVEHIDAAGKATSFDVPRELEGVEAVAVAPDGTGWFATQRCKLLRISPTGATSTTPSPVPARELAFDPSGGLWLASRARLAHLAPGEAPGVCDDRAPSIHIGPVRDGGHISLRGLRRGLTITVREPAEVFAEPLYDEGSGRDSRPGTDLDRIVRGARGATVRFRVPAEQVDRFSRALAAGRKPSFTLSALASDAEDNDDVVTVELRVTR